MQAQFVGDFRRIHGIRQILKDILVKVHLKSYLFVGKDKQDSIAQFILGQHTHQFFTGFSHTFSIIAVNNEDQALGILEVVAPQWSDFVLTAHIPNRK
jgi:hypothetical protein